MPTLFANPWGFLGLLAIPVILAIHFLREKSRRLPVSTLFLLDPLAPRTPTGRTFSRLQNSLPLCLQLFIALLATWLLAQPRWIRTDSRQRVTFIFDHSASMAACRQRVLNELPKLGRQLSKGAASTDWLCLLTSQPESPLYRGSDLNALFAALETWRPALPTHDPARAFAVALLDSHGGSIFYVTDRPSELLPAGITLLSFGEAIPNCGFAGVRTWRDSDGLHWEALIRNAGSTDQERDCWFETGKSRSIPHHLKLKPGEIVTLPGPFLPDQKQIRLQLTPDDFTLDDTLPLVAPEPKTLNVAVLAPSKFVERALATIPGLAQVTDPALADVIVTNPEHPAPEGSNAIIFGTGAAKANYLGGAITTEPHPLTHSAVWNGLLSAGPQEITLSAHDEALVWQRDLPLVFVRNLPKSSQLFFNFDFAASNAERLPATVLLFTRFLEKIQTAKNAPFAQNFETHQELPLPLGSGFELVSESGEASVLHPPSMRAPLEPGFFTVQHQLKPLLRAAAYFADPREADFREASSTLAALDSTRLINRQFLEADRWTNLWLFLLGAALIGSWAFQSRRTI